MATSFSTKTEIFPIILAWLRILVSTASDKHEKVSIDHFKSVSYKLSTIKKVIGSNVLDQKGVVIESE